MRAIALPLATLVLGAFMTILDTTVVNVALPTLGKTFGTDLRLLQWVITGYSLAQAAVIPLSGWLSDRFGAKQVYLISLALFTVGSVLCAVAPSGEGLVAFRVIQGLGGGMVMPIGMAFLYRLAPEGQRGAVMGAFGIPMLLGPALGPVLSGWLVEFADWRLIFLINLPVGVLAVLLGLRALPALAAQRAAGRLDAPGMVLAPLAFAALTYGIGESTGNGWTSSATLLGMGVGALALVTFVWRELSVEEPLLELRVFRSSRFTLTIVTQWIASAAMFGTVFLIPVFLQQVRGYGSFQTGITTLPQATVAAVFMPIGGRIFDRFGVRPAAISGLLVMALSLWLQGGITAETTSLDLLLPLGLWGAGLGLMMMPLNTYLLGAAPRDLVGRVTSLSTSLQSVVMSLGVAGAAMLLQARMGYYTVAFGASPSSAALAFGDVFKVAAVGALVAAGLACFLRRGTTEATVAEERDVTPAIGLA